MAMNSNQQKKVTRLQDNLYTIRQLAGWSADDLAEMLDVTKQTVYNLERGKPKMSWVQYLAIRTLIEREIIQQPENEVLPKAVSVLLDNKELPDEEFNELQESLKTIAKGMSKKTDREIALKLALKTVGAVTFGVMTKDAKTAIAAWLTMLND